MINVKSGKFKISTIIERPQECPFCDLKIGDILSVETNLFSRNKMVKITIHGKNIDIIKSEKDAADILRRFLYIDDEIHLSEPAKKKIEELSLVWGMDKDSVCDDLILSGLNFSSFIADYRKDKEYALKYLEELISRYE
ncbi:MAG: hypothetical protein NC124_02445 [Clostridium sp.]|nr:hypothetical protein [Clostridium sp.]